ncbi:MAG: HAMP domain-containing histidine kinase [Planctomycetes bacterium]|nr:HAMP domain-containing histidine kinase [Planctomycetota bacterium]
MKHWTLSSWLARRVFLVSAVPVVVAFAVGGWFVDRSLSREIEALVHEEFDEASMLLRESLDPQEHFGFVTEQLSQSHRLFPMAWRVRPIGAREPKVDYGDAVLFDHLTTAVPLDASVELEGRLVVGRRIVHGELDVMLAVDGSVLESVLAWYWIIATVISCAVSLLGAAFGQMFGRRVGTMLRRAAEHVQSTREGDSAADDLELPDEILSIATELRTTLEKIREESERARVFVASLAHELRSPIQNLIAEAEVLLLRAREPNEYRAKFRAQLEELVELGHAVNNLMAFCARSESEPTSRAEEFDLGNEVRLRLQQEIARAERAGIQVALDASGDLRMRGDRESILRALRNVIANAIDWSPTASTIDFELTGEPEQIHVTVRDRGPGIPDADRPRVFEPFFRRDSNERRRGGYGLGLAIAHDAVVRQGGSIALDGARGEGTTCSIQLPRAPRPSNPNGTA